jgi:hypothetical protein
VKISKWVISIVPESTAILLGNRRKNWFFGKTQEKLHLTESKRWVFCDMKRKMSALNSRRNLRRFLEPKH